MMTVDHIKHRGKAESLSGVNVLLTAYKFKRDHKRLARRQRRRAEKRDPENAPERLREIVKGWCS